MNSASRDNSRRADRRAPAAPREADTLEQRLCDAAVVAVRVQAEEWFTLRRRRFDIPPGWVCLSVGAEGPMELLGASTTIARGAFSELFLARLEPVRVELVATGMRSGDPYDADLRLSTSVHVLPERGELCSLRSRLAADARTIGVRDVERWLAASLREAVEPIVRRSTMESLTQGEAREEWLTAARRALDTAAFAAGLSVGRDFDARLDSPAFERVRRTQDDVARRRREQEAMAPVREAQQKARAEQVDQAADLLNRLQSLTTQSPGASVAELIRSFAEHERARLYEALFARPAAQAQTRHVVAACGESLLVFDPRDAARAPARVALSGSAGPVRSLTYDAAARRLLAGAATGVYVIAPDEWRIEREVAVAAPPSVRGGFNSAALAGDALLASHSELGIWAWPLGAATAGVQVSPSVTRGAKAIRAVQLHGGRAYCAVDQRIIAWSADALADPSTAAPVFDVQAVAAPITALKVLDDAFIVGDSDGRVTLLSNVPGGERRQLHPGRGRAVESLGVIDHDGVRRLFFTDTSVCVHARVLDDAFTWRYEASGQTLRRAVVAADSLAALTELRDRVLLFKLHDPSRPSAVLLVSQLSGRSVQDVALI